MSPSVSHKTSPIPETVVNGQTIFISPLALTQTLNGHQKSLLDNHYSWVQWLLTQLLQCQQKLLFEKPVFMSQSVSNKTSPIPEKVVYGELMFISPLVSHTTSQWSSKFTVLTTTIHESSGCSNNLFNASRSCCLDFFFNPSVSHTTSPITEKVVYGLSHNLFNAS